MNWQIVAAVAGVFAGIGIPALGLLNAWLLNQVRLSISAMKIEMLQLLTKDREDTRTWIERDFQRKEEARAWAAEAKARSENVLARVMVLENRRRDSDQRAA